MAETQRLQFSIGPVQGFVAQSRRTRDLWASSFMLSHLAATAIEAVRTSGGTLVLPAWDEETRGACQNHYFGTVPNRFVADFFADDAESAKQDAKVAADAAQQSLLAVWNQITNVIRDKFVSPVVGAGDGTLEIWERQVANFWEITWIVGAVEESSTLLAARKNWRTTPATVEPGDHCTMMSDRQELSGWIRSQASRKQDEFWKVLRSKLGPLDLADDERLCAIALIKRLFPKVAKDAIGRDLKHNNWPSTAYIAAIPWLVKVAKCDTVQCTASAYADEVLDRARTSRGERYTTIPELQDLKKQGLTGEFLDLDGNFFQRNAIANERVTPLETLREGETDEQARRALQKQLSKLCDDVGEKPSAFYAMLLMDGDSMGALLGEARKLPGGNGESLATKALSNFSIGVPDIVGQHYGVTIYAGGDDVLAMLPLDCALKCASQLAKAYQTEFTSKIGAEAAKQATLSGAVVYAHYHVPLRDVLKTAHHMLDDVAKDATGRDSLAIAVFKSSGITAQWSAPWEHIRDVGVAAKSDNIVDALRIDLGGQPLTSCDLAESLSDSKPGHGVAEQRSTEFSSGFLYNVRERFAALTDKALTRPGEFGRLSQELCDNGNDLFKSVLVADYLRGKQKREAEGGTAEERHEERLTLAKAAIDRLLKLSQRVTRFRLEGSSPPKFEFKHHPDTLGIDGALVVRFLANDGKEDAE